MASDTHLAAVYLAYAALALGLTIGLARTLFKNGETFLEEVFLDRPRLARSVNRLLVVGFYLFNFGFASLLLRGGSAPNAVGAIETLSEKLGALLLSLAVMHFFNLLVFYIVRRSRRAHGMEAPIAPHAYVPPPSSVVAGASL
jgi:hypothetical protein